MNGTWSIVGIVLLVCSCNGSSNQSDDTGTTHSIEKNENLVPTNAPFSLLKRAPKNTYSKDSIYLESYNFEDFEPFLHQVDDYTYVVNFWATWCVPCVKELPYFEQLYTNYASQNVHVLLVSIDFSKAVETSLIPFLEKEKLQSEVVLLDDPDANKWIPKVDESWSGAIPATVIYNKRGRAFFEKSFTYDELETELLKILN